VEVLFDLRHMSVGAAGAVGRSIAEDLGGGEVRLECLARAGDAIGKNCIEPGRRGEPGLDEWCEAERHGGDIAAGHGDALRGPQYLALFGAAVGEEFGQAVGPGALMVRAVELLPGGGADEAVIGGEVDDEGVRARGFEFGGDLSGLSVRECEDDDIVAGEYLGGGLLDPKFGETGKMGLMSAECLAHGRVSAHRCDVRMGVSAQQPEALSPGVSGGTGGGNTEIVHMYNYTSTLNYMQEAS